VTPEIAVRRMAPREVAVATRESKPARSTRSGTTTMPPPTPKSALRKPEAIPMPPRIQSDGVAGGTTLSYGA